MSIKIDRFEPFVAQGGIKFTIDNSVTVLIKDHTTDKIVGMVNLDKISDNNIEIAEKVIEAIEEWIVNQNED